MPMMSPPTLPDELHHGGPHARTDLRSAGLLFVCAKSGMSRFLTLLRRGWYIAVLVGIAACSKPNPTHAPASTTNACALTGSVVRDSFEDLAALVAIETYRHDDNEATVQANLGKIDSWLQKKTNDFNVGQKTHKLEMFAWREPNKSKSSIPSAWWVFGIRLGKGPHKISVITHLDTVHPGTSTEWAPFRLARQSIGGKDFWIGRGVIDDKGPAFTSFLVLQAIARAYDGNPLLDRVSLELLFDTSEETDMSTPHYFAANPGERPNLAVVYDASWCIRAEKGVERPTFVLPRGAATTRGLWIESLNTSPGSVNQIPGETEAVIRGDSPQALKQLAATIVASYDSHPFDDPSYHRAKLAKRSLEDILDNVDHPTKLTLRTLVDGAQHGSAPQENRAEGANPLVSLTNFLGALVDQKVLADNEVGRMCRFIRWAWGTRVFGEHHAQLLESYDPVFEKKPSEKDNNGTTYAITKFRTEDKQVILELDIRYAIGHHSQPWNGQDEGLLPGDRSRFPEIFEQLVGEFDRGGARTITFTTDTKAAPDIRRPEGPTFQRVSQAYQDVMGTSCPATAVGGGTDAKGMTNFLAAGALFTPHLGPPINFHGINEGAPVDDLAGGARILCRLFERELQQPAELPAPRSAPQRPWQPRSDWR